MFLDCSVLFPFCDRFWGEQSQEECFGLKRKEDGQIVGIEHERKFDVLSFLRGRRGAGKRESDLAKMLV